MGRKKDPMTSYFGEYPLMNELKKAHFVIKLRNPRMKWTLRNLGNKLNNDIESTVMRTRNALVGNIEMKELKEMTPADRKRHVEWFLKTVLTEIEKDLEMSLFSEEVEYLEEVIELDRVAAGYAASRD